jgi:hypothetical protein
MGSSSSPLLSISQSRQSLDSHSMSRWTTTAGVAGQPQQVVREPQDVTLEPAAMINPALRTRNCAQIAQDV